MMPRGIVRVYAMARPRRPDSEAVAVAAAAGTGGSAAQRARRLAALVAKRTMADIDVPPDEHLISLLARIDPSPVARLATDPEIDTAALIRAARAAAMEANGWRRLTEAEWSEIDRAILSAVTDRLARRYARLLARFQP